MGSQPVALQSASTLLRGRNLPFIFPAIVALRSSKDDPEKLYEIFHTIRPLDTPEVRGRSTEGEDTSSKEAGPVGELIKLTFGSLFSYNCFTSR